MSVQEWEVPTLWEGDLDTPIYDYLLAEQWSIMKKHQPGRDVP